MKLTILATIVYVAAGTAIAQGTDSDNSDGLDASVALPVDVAERVAELRSFGGRFEAAARLIEQQAAIPTWGWNSCEHEGTQVVATLPES